MFNLNATLDNLIAMVVVLLALSLVVQAVQAAVKKAFKLKSRQIEDSLVHLFKFVIEDTDEQTPDPSKWKSFWTWIGRIPILGNFVTSLGAIFHQSPFLRILTWRPHPAEKSGSATQTLYNEVMDKFKAIGRTALSTKPILDSISKADLLKVIGSIKPKSIDPTIEDKIEAAIDGFKAWDEILNGFNPQNVAGFLSDDDKAKLSEMQAKLKPLLDDLRPFLSGTISIEKIIDDVAKLRAINLDNVQKILSDVRARVAQAIANAKLNQNTAAETALSALDTELKKLSDAIALFRKELDAVFAKWVKLEDSFDTVMQSFEERYTRSMRTAAIIIGFLVVVFLNANFFKVYQQIATSDAKRELILQSREEVVRALNKNNTQPPEETVQAWFKASQDEINNSSSQFIGYGFQPLTLHQTEKWFCSLNPFATEDIDGNKVLDDKGNTGTYWQTGVWWKDRKHDAQVLIGWIIMALLLSVGAPFWQDFLESLFGVKNVLRKKSETQNVEQKPGAGQTRQS